MPTSSQILYDKRTSTYLIRLADGTGLQLEYAHRFATRAEAEERLREMFAEIGEDYDAGEVVPVKRS